MLDKRVGAGDTGSPGREYSMADIINFPWIRESRAAQRRPQRLSQSEALARDTMAARPAVQRGCAVLTEKQRKGPMTDAEREVMFGKTQFAAH